MVGALPADRLARSLGAEARRRASGFAVLAAGLALGLGTSLGSGDGFVAVWMALVGAGMGLAMATASSAALSELSRSAAGSAPRCCRRSTRPAAAGAAMLGSILARPTCRACRWPVYPPALLAAPGSHLRRGRRRGQAALAGAPSFREARVRAGNGPLVDGQRGCRRRRRTGAAIPTWHGAPHRQEREHLFGTDVLRHACPPRAGLRERKKARTRAAIQAAALDLFERRGYHATTVDQIGAQAEVSRRRSSATSRQKRTWSCTTATTRS